MISQSAFFSNREILEKVHSFAGKADIVKPSLPFVAFLLCLFSWSACGPEDTSDATEAVEDILYSVALTCEPQPEGEDGTPQNVVMATVNENRTRIADIAACELLEEHQYAELGIPADALTAVGGWWAGSGDYIYATKDTLGELTFHHLVIDEQATEPSRQEIVRFREGKFTFLD